MTSANKRQLPETENNDGDNPTEGSSSKIPKQTKLDYAPRTVGRAVQHKVDSCLVKLITKDFQPFSIVEDKGFRSFVSVLNPAYQIPSRKTITNNLLPTIYEETLTEVKSIVRNVKSVTITTDDNAANITKAVKDILHWKHLECLAHTINLIAKDSITIIGPVIAKIRNLVAHFKRSTSATAKLLDVQKQSGKIPKKLLQYVSTRWNSTYYMLERILDLEEAVRTTMALLDKDNLPIIVVEEWQLLKHVKKVLEPYPIHKTMADGNLISCSKRPRTVLTPEVKTIIINVFDGLKKRENMGVSDAVSLCSFLTKVLESSIYKIIKENKKGVKEPNTETRGRKMIVLDEEIQRAIRQKIHSFFFRNEILTLKKISAEIDSDDSLPKISREVLLRTLHIMNFK
ncbi:zinc finger BED domain-containing protein 4-like [Diabrotica undecimpunctata]|uniref:zinc finger BED domain-containing protein 4-like n=1 Tax=Diabrotica undecimpunctata TaxID=50387 RepID=UPI003B63B000